MMGGMSSTGQEPPAPHVPPPGPAVAQPGAPAAWAWAQPQQSRTVETEPLEYHRLLRGVANYRWWKPLLLLLLSGVYFGILTVLLTVIFIPLMMVLDPEYASDLASGSAELLDTQRPVSLLLSLLSIIIMIPAVVLAMLSLGMRPVGRVWSVAARMRWGLLARLTGAALLAVVVMNVAGIAVELALDPVSLSEPVEAGGAGFDARAAVVSLILVLLLVPFQAAAEEVVFRGLFMQVLGSWLRSPWFGILIPSVGFALAHIYNFWGLAAVGLMGGVAAWLTWRTGGLEAAIAIHVVNNLVAFGLMTAGFGGETAQTADAGGPGSVVGEVVGLGLFIWLALRIFGRGGHGRTRIDLQQVPVVPTVAQAPSAPHPAAAPPPAVDAAAPARPADPPAGPSAPGGGGAA